MALKISKWLVISTVLALCGIIRCDPLELNDDTSQGCQTFNEISDHIIEDEIRENPRIESNIGNAASSGQSDNEKCGDRKANRAKQNKNCVYPHRSTKPLYCYYSLRWGERSSNDKKVFEKNYETSSTTEALEINVRDVEGRFINFMMLEDSKNNRNDRIFEDYVRIRKGGMNCSNVTLTIESDDPALRHYRFIVYAK